MDWENYVFLFLLNSKRSWRLKYPFSTDTEYEYLGLDNGKYYGNRKL